MSLHPTMKRRLHERLHPLIGEEEADALLDDLTQDPVTRESASISGSTGSMIASTARRPSTRSSKRWRTGSRPLSIGS